MAPPRVNYYCAFAWNGHGEFSQTGAHQFRLAAPGSDVLEFTIAFAPASIRAARTSRAETRPRLGAHQERAAAPKPRDGVYPAIETAPYTPLIDPEVMRRTLDSVKADWEWPSTWGWDYPVLAMCAARLGDASGAIDGLLMPMPKNTYLPNGHNLQIPSFLPLYLPGNGGLLSAVAMMAAGWDGGPARHAPGFPDDGTWVVQTEGLAPFP